MNKFLLTAAMLVSMAATPALAQDRFLFGFSDQENAPRATLTFDGVTSFVATDTGWINSAGDHDAANANYLTGTSDGDQYNSFFSFAIGALAPISAYTSATLTLRTGQSEGAAPFALRLSDVGASFLELDRDRVRGDAAGQALFTDLGSGVSYGDFTVNVPTVRGQTFTINLNQTFLSQVNSGLLTDFSIGGTLSPAQAVVAAVPEPGTWAMLIIGFGIAGAALRRRKTKVATRVAFA